MLQMVCKNLLPLLIRLLLGRLCFVSHAQNFGTILGSSLSLTTLHLSDCQAPILLVSIPILSFSGHCPKSLELMCNLINPP